MDIWTCLTLCLRVRGGQIERLKKTGRTRVGSKVSLCTFKVNRREEAKKGGEQKQRITECCFVSDPVYKKFSEF